MNSALPFRPAAPGGNVSARSGLVLACVAVVANGLGAYGSVDPGQLPAPAGTVVEYERDIRPIFEGACFRCHGPERPKSGFSLSAREPALRGGDLNADNIVPGDSAASRLIHYAARLVEDMEMPPPGKGNPLTTDQVGLLRAWIDQGARWADDEALAGAWPQGGFKLAGGYIGVSGDQRKFREHYWGREGRAGGLETFRMQSALNEGAVLGVEGRVLFGEEDYRVAFDYTKRDKGFVRGGYEQFRKYYDDTGGYYELFTAPSFDLDRDLHLDIGRAWVQFGLTMPELPQITLGYEHRFKDGSKSSLQWGDVREGARIRKIYPAAKDIDERVHLITLDVSHEVAGWRFEDNFRGEFYDSDTVRDNPSNFTVGQTEPQKVVVVREGHSHFQGANTIRFEKWAKEWWMLGGGYLYSRLDGDAAFSQDTVLANPAMPSPANGFNAPDRFWFSDSIVLEQESHVFSFSSFLGPWQDVTITGAVQAEWTRQDGFGEVRLDEIPPPLTGGVQSRPATLQANIDRRQVGETAGLRWTKIPFTVVHAEAVLQQESLGQFERGTLNGAQDFLRDTDTTSDLRQYRFGFNTSPWTRFSLGASHRVRDKDSDYDHRTDEAGAGNPGAGYSAFIRGREIESEESEVKLVLKPVSWLKTTLKYQRTEADYTTRTDPVPPGVVTPGGTVAAGRFDSDTYSLSLALAPHGRLHFSVTGALTDARTSAFANNAASVEPYRGSINSVLTGVQFHLDERTDVSAWHSWSRADFRQHNAIGGLPAGIEYDRHEIRAGFTRRFSTNVSGGLHYGYFNYSEPSSGGANDYEAHAVFATMGIRLP